MTVPLLQAVPNFSEGRDLGIVADIIAAMREAGADVLDWSADPDHHRSVVTIVGAPAAIEAAAIAAARVAIERIDLRGHRGVHPRIGALDVLPFVPLAGLEMDEARQCAWRTGERLANEVGVPVYYYAEASNPPGRALRDLRRGGFEALVTGWPAEQQPNLLPREWPHPGAHPTAGATCVGARRPLLAWNVYVENITKRDAAAVARRVRERDGGWPGVRALALALPASGRLQISMNIEDLDATSPFAVYRALEALIAARGGRIVETEVIGLVPERLVAEAAEERLRLPPGAASRLLPAKLLEHLLRNPGAARSSNPEQSTI
jgi:glutamate formiminotransferase